MSPWLSNVYKEIVMQEVILGMEKRGVRFLEEVRERECLASFKQMTWF